MPLYEYECDHCHQVTEALQKFSDQPLAVCPKCGGQLSKLMSLNSFALKGGGWYATDYAKSGAKSEGVGAKKTERADGSKADSASGPKDSSPAKPTPDVAPSKS
jgi:putative FmdB family regulatory protein